MRTIDSPADIAEGLEFLQRKDRRLRPVVAVAGPVPLRRSPAGFAGLARIVTGQQLSVAAAEAIWQRFQGLVGEVSPPCLAAASDRSLRAAGLSAAKVRTLRAIALAVEEGGLDLAGLGLLPAEEVRVKLLEIKGIGPWTADLYRLFCLGHPDIFPVGDLALRLAVADAFGRAEPVPLDELETLARRWSPWRGVAARLFWSYYRARRGRAGVAE